MSRFFNLKSLTRETSYSMLKHPRTLLALSCLVCTILTIWAWYPGSIRDDAMAQYLQATGVVPVTDWHPPLMVRFWQAEIFLFHTPNLLNATYILIFAISVFLLLSARVNKKSWAFCILIFLCPICLMSNGEVYKDILLADLLLLVSGIIISTLAQHRELSPTQKYSILLLLIVAAFLRFNAIFIIAPLMILVLFNWQLTFSRLIGSLGIVLVCCYITPTINNSLLKAGKDYAVTSLQVFDLGGIAWENLRQPDQKQIFKKWNKSSTEEQLAACYSTEGWDGYGRWEPVNALYLKASWDNRLHVVENTVLNNFTTETVDCQNLGDQLRSNPDNIKHLWANSIKHHPWSWLKHRYGHFHQLLGVIGEKGGHLHVVGVEAPGLYNLDWVHSTNVRSFPGKALAHTTKKLLRFPAHLTQYGSFWLAVAMFLFISSLACSNKKQRIVNCLSFSCITYIVGYFFVSVGGMLRYFLPAIYLIIAAIICTFSFTEKLSNRRHTIAALIASLLIMSLSFI